MDGAPPSFHACRFLAVEAPMCRNVQRIHRGSDGALPSSSDSETNSGNCSMPANVPQDPSLGGCRRDFGQGAIELAPRVAVEALGWGQHTEPVDAFRLA